MLAKIWKKLLLAICIIACLFNITTKLVNRTSLELNLKKANDGTGILDILREEKKTSDSSDLNVIDGVKETNTNNITKNKENSNNVNNSIKSDFVVLF